MWLPGKLPFKLSTVVRGSRKKPLFQIFKERETTPCGRLFHRLTEKRREEEGSLSLVWNHLASAFKYPEDLIYWKSFIKFVFYKEIIIDLLLIIFLKPSRVISSIYDFSAYFPFFWTLPFQNSEKPMFWCSGYKIYHLK